jgi:CRISPR-associated protein Csd2
MGSLTRKIDFAVIFAVDHANPNGDPLNGNRPRVDYNGRGEVSDVCIKRKMRDRLMEAGQPILVQSDDRKNDDAKSLKDRVEKTLGKDGLTRDKACAAWLDVRAFGQLFAFKSGKKTLVEGDGDGVSIPIRGPVTVQSAFSVDLVSVASVQITKSVSGEGDGAKRSSDTMGMKHRVDKGVYVFFGSMNPQLAERTGFSNADAESIKAILPKLFENDASAARPEGSMAVKQVFWWKHNCRSGQYSSAKVHDCLKVNPDGTFNLDESGVPGLKAELLPVW